LVAGKFNFRDLVDVDQMREMCERFSEATGFTTGLVTHPEQELLFGTGWREICTDFHRACSPSELHCRESNLELTASLTESPEIAISHCKSGLEDGATPIIIKGVHVANLFTGQILFEKPDTERFRQQAVEFGYDTEAYLKALEKVPVVSEVVFRNALSFLNHLATAFAEMGLRELNARTMQEKLESSRGHLKALVETLPDIVWLKDPGGVYLNCNSRFEEFIGARESEIVGKTDHDLVDRELADFFREKDLAAIAAGEPTLNEEEVTFASDGHREFLETIKTPMFDSNGELVGVLGIARDITARKQVESALKEERNLFIAGPAMVFKWKAAPDWPVEYASGTVMSLLGYTVQKLKAGDPAFADLVHPDDLARVAEEVDRHTRAGAERFDHLPYRLRHRDGNYLWVADYTTVLRDAAGDVTHYLGYLVDITRQRESEERLDLAIAGTRAGLWDWHVPTGTVVFNERWAEIAGYTLEELGPLSIQIWTDICHPDDMKRSSELLQEHFAGTREQYQFEARMKHKDGSWVWVLDSGKVVERDDQGNPVRMVGTHIDISERKRFEILNLAERDLGVTWNRSLPLQERWETCLAKAIEVSGMDCGCIYRVVENGSGLTLAAHQGVSEAFAEEVRHFPLDSDTARLVLAGKPVDGLYDKLELSNNSAARREGLRAAALIPVVATGVIACLEVASRTMDEVPEYARSNLEHLARFIASLIERELAEERGRQHQRDIESVFETIDDMLFVLDGEDRIIATNPAVYSRLGCSANELIGTCSHLLHPEDRRDEARAVHAEILAGKADTCPIPIQTKSGELIQVETRFKPGRWDNRDVFFGISRDIGIRLLEEELARRTLQRRSREAEALAAVATNRHLAQGDVAELARDLTTAAARALEVERVGVWLFENDQSELVSVDNYVLSTGEHSSEAGLSEREFRNEFDALKKAKYIASDDPLTDPSTAGYVEGYLIPNRITAMLDAVVRRGGQILGVVCLEHVDRSHHWEEDEISFACQLADQVALALTNREYRQMQEEKSKLEDQYRQAQKMETIGKLAGGVAHDLNNLLTPILGYSEMIREGLTADDSTRESLDQIVGAGMRARDLVRQLLAFGRKQVLEYKRTDLNRIMDGFESLLRRTIPEDVYVNTITSPTDLPITVDTGQIEQVVLNLAINAADSMPKGGRLTLETAAVHLDESYADSRDGVEPGDYAMLAVSDTGHGMDSETLGMIFEPFFTTKGAAGTGLGLATAYGIVKQHGGNIWAYSEIGKGATFKVYLPLCRSSQAPEGGRARGTTTDLSGTETILLVEDNDQVRALAVAILQRRGYSVTVAGNGLEALELLDRHEGRVHLLLTDVVMPEMNGKELFAKAVARRPDLKVLFMSGYTENVIAQRGVLEEDIAFIQKPFTVKNLSAKVREVLDG
jgi:PAS domain S-box-containing protein